MRGVIRALAAVRRRLPLPPRREAAPLALLLLALSPVFAFGGDRSQFYREEHDRLSADTITLAANLSPEHRFLGFERRERLPDGGTRYAAYNRHPISAYALVRLAILPFGDDFPRQIRAAGLLMLACFAAAAVTAYLALALLTGDRRIALAATLLAFSSYYLLYYNDMISVEASAPLFGIMLVFHGMVVHEREGRFRQLLAKTAVAILLGWFVAALIAPFVVLGTAGEAARARAGGGGLRTLAAAVRGRYALYGACSALFAALLLGWNFANEYLAFGGARALTDLPTLKSALEAAGFEEGVGWPEFVRGQLAGIGGMAIPHALVDGLGLNLPQPGSGAWPPPSSQPPFATLGAALFAAALTGLRFLPQRLPVAALLLAGWCWTVSFRHIAYSHEYYALWHTGVPLVLYALALLGLRRLLGRERAARALPAIAVAAAPVFVLSAALMGGVGHGAEAAALRKEAETDFRAMRDPTDGGSVLLAGARAASNRLVTDYLEYWLGGRFLQDDAYGSAGEWARASRHDYVVVPADFGGSLTPGNRRFHLYRTADLPRVHASIAADEPSLRAPFDLRLDGRTLTYARQECSRDDAALPFFLEAVPADGGPAVRLDFALHDHGVRFGGACLARIALPGEPLAGLRTGQRAEGLPALWEASLPVGDASFPRGVSGWRETAEAARPALSSAFAVSLEGRTLHYVREGCGDADAAARFFVHVLPLDARDLPEARRPYGSERFAFGLRDRGLRHGGLCLASFALPDYAILGVRTGQYGDGGEVWSGQFPLDPGAWRARYEAAAAVPPAISSKFGVRLDGRTLHYTREDCAAADTEARFFLHVTPLDANDLPEERREAGFANLDFAFGDRGLRYEGRCLASVPLPGYPVARLATGQFEGGARLWEGEIAFGE